jgi:hypothetical protein
MVGNLVAEAAACMMAGAQGQIEVRETPDLVIGDARRVCVPIRRVLRTCRGAGESGAGDGGGVVGGPGFRLYRAGKAEHYAGASSSWISTT